MFQVEKTCEDRSLIRSILDHFYFVDGIILTTCMGRIWEENLIKFVISPAVPASVVESRSETEHDHRQCCREK